MLAIRLLSKGEKGWEDLENRRSESFSLVESELERNCPWLSDSDYENGGRMYLFV